MIASLLILLKWSYIQRARAFCGLPEVLEPPYQAPAEAVEYEEPLDKNLKAIINYWFEVFGKLLTHEVSQREILRSAKFFDGEVRDMLVKCGTHVFGHFLYEKKVHINNSKARSYSTFIIGEMEKVVKGLEVDEFFV